MAAKAELVVAVLLAALACAYLQRMHRGRTPNTWHGLISAFAVLMLAVVIFLEGIKDMRLYL